jgi:hypothetical protein
MVSGTTEAQSSILFLYMQVPNPKILSLIIACDLFLTVKDMKLSGNDTSDGSCTKKWVLDVKRKSILD